jgi:hypothetical protein
VLAAGGDLESVGGLFQDIFVSILWKILKPMRNYTMPERQALSRIWPKDRVSRRQFLWIVAFVVIGVACAVGWAYTRDKVVEYRERNWDSAIATVEDVRPILVGDINTNRGGKMLYAVEVLARYTIDGATKEQWITVDQLPTTLDSVNVQRTMWKGRTYPVRWNPRSPNQIQIDIR